ncbi:hypothetical protein SAMN05192560_1408 [Methylobacillus rhizosphaerae]|uniref:DUF4139 domain-containing protein n=1 Tax=Methylobacillus rhizosphaerae TaxID=551994 RepID=A0A238ZNJ2_9PROT|nr:DUF4139 domain-containing protein [Methylobacillus rhizosphaerae]SNR85016.1 hypothetical protein SAMN05192560_1408 [Methylobacillus rhizosphaerae]
MTFKPTLLALGLLSAFQAMAADDEIRSTLHDQQSVAVTIYNGNLALIKDQRKVNLNTGLNALALRDVSAQIRPETALLRSLRGQLQTLEQNFDYDLLSPEKLLEKYIGQTVQVIRTNPATGAETIEPAEVLAVNNGTVLRMGNRIETGIPGRIVFPDVPENLRDRPTLVTQLNARQAGLQDIELSYLTSGLSWQADYVAELSPAEDKLDLSGWVTLSNTSGTSYRDAKLQLVAGDVNRVVTPRPSMPLAAMRKNEMMVADAAPAMSEEALLEYHLYSLDRPTTLAENQTKQVALLSAQSIPVRKELVLRGSNYYYQSSQGDLGQKLKVGVFVEFDNKESAKLGKPLPKGVMRVYKQDSQGNAQFVGEDRIDHTAKNETVRLKLGESFDVTANKKQTDFKKLPNPAKGNSQFESAYEIVLKNAKKQPATVTVVEPIPGDWRILSQNHTSSKTSSNTASWQIAVPAEGTATLTYRVQVRY